MASVNKVILIGNLTRDPEVRYMPSGDAMCSVTVATSENWKDKATGEKREATEYNRVSFHGRLAEIAGQYLKKGASVYVEGGLRTRKWTDKDGVDRYSTEVRATEMKMLGGRRDGDAPMSEPEAPAAAAPAAPRGRPAKETAPAAAPAAAPAMAGDGFDGFSPEDDIPF